MIEIEKKYKLNKETRTLVLGSLAEIGAHFAGDDLEENIIYNGGALNGRSCILRVRKTLKTTFLTFKERIENQSDVKKQVEHETEAADPASLIMIIESLGFRRQLVYEKRRKTWKMRNAEVVLDELPFGQFMEIEGSITAIKEAEIMLGIEEIETEHETYPSLTAKFGMEVEGVIESRFSDQ